MTDETKTTESATSKGFVEFVGEQPFGAQFIDNRVITRKDARDGWDISIPKDLRWTKDRQGRMRLPLADIPAEALEKLRDEPGFKVVTE